MVKSDTSKRLNIGTLFKCPITPTYRLCKTTRQRAGKTNKMEVISLFAGIEGFGLAAHKVGWEVVASVEWEKFPQMVIKKNFPNTEIHGDIKQFDGQKYRGAIDIVCGGFPCQPYSLAGKRKGTDDDRHLWPEMLRVIREVQPTWVIGENVPGLVNWSEGVVFEEVQSDLEAEGYEVQSFILPAASVGAPHRRDRVWIIAYSDRYGRSRGENEKHSTERRQPSQCRVRQCNGDGNATNAAIQGREARQQIRGQSDSPENRTGVEFRNKRPCNDGLTSNASGTGQQKQNLPTEPTKQRFNTRGDNAPGSAWQVFPTQSPICNGNDGVSADLVRYILRNGGDCYTEEEAGKEAKRIISKVRAEGIKAGGNAIVHQVALQIFKAIEEFENLHSLMKRH